MGLVQVSLHIRVLREEVKQFPYPLMDSIAVWNIRGLNEPAKQFVVRQLLRNNKLVLAGILETRVNKKKNVLAGIGECNCLDNYSHAYNGRIWVLFDSRKVDAACISVGDQFVHCEVTWLATGKSCFISY